MVVRPLRENELETATQTLALAFDDDPLFRYLMPGRRTRPPWIRWFHRRALRECLRVGGALTIDGPEVAVVGLYPAHTWPPSFLASVRTFPLPPLPWALPPPRLLTVGLGIESRIHRAHPSEPHVYIYVLGVHPLQKGKGFGGALLRHAKKLAEDAGARGHLETSNPVNLSLYRRFGYEVTETIEVRGAPPVWTMTTGA